MPLVWRNVQGNIVVGGLRISQNTFYLKKSFYAISRFNLVMVLARTYSFEGSKGRNLLRRSNAKEKTVIADFDCMLFVLSYFKAQRVEMMGWNGKNYFESHSNLLLNVEKKYNYPLVIVWKYIVWLVRRLSYRYSLIDI